MIAFCFLYPLAKKIGWFLVDSTFALDFSIWLYGVVSKLVVYELLEVNTRGWLNVHLTTAKLYNCSCNTFETMGT